MNAHMVEARLTSPVVGGILSSLPLCQIQPTDPRFAAQRQTIQRVAARLLTTQKTGGDGKKSLHEQTALDLGRLTPMQALEKLHEWQRN